MEYTRFVRLRGPRWDAFEAELSRLRREPRATSYAQLEDLAFRYRQVLHDYALTRSRFSRTGAAERLKRLAVDGAHALQHDEARSIFGLVHFFTRTFPQAFHLHLPVIAVALAVFVASALFGLFTAAVQPSMGLAFLGPDALEGLQNGELWTDSLSTSVPPTFSSSAIATNNMGVAIMGWAGGALAGLGGLYILFLNGLLLGTVFGVTSHYGMSGRLAEFVAAHGPLEITLILVVTGAGLNVGRALLEAGEEPRRLALPRAARASLALLLGSLPWFVLLGFVEGFISPLPTIPLALKLVLGLSLEALFLLAAWNPFLPSTAP